MRTLGVAWCLVLAAVIAPAISSHGDSYSRVLFAFPRGTAITVAAWLLTVNWLLRQLLVVALRTPGSRMRAGARNPWADDAT